MSMRVIYSCLCAASMFVGTYFMIVSWRGIWSFMELGEALSSHRACQGGLMMLSWGLAFLFAFLASRQPQRDIPTADDSEKTG